MATYLHPSVTMGLFKRRFGSLPHHLPAMLCLGRPVPLLFHVIFLRNYETALAAELLGRYVADSEDILQFECYLQQYRREFMTDEWMRLLFGAFVPLVESWIARSKMAALLDPPRLPYRRATRETFCLRRGVYFYRSSGCPDGLVAEGGPR